MQITDDLLRFIVERNGENLTDEQKNTFLTELKILKALSPEHLDKTLDSLEDKDQEKHKKTQALLDQGFYRVNNEGKRVPLYREMADYLRDVFFAKYIHGKLYLYSNGKYEAETSINRITEKLTKGTIDIPGHFINFDIIIKSSLLAGAKDPEKLKESVEGKINLNNGVYDVKSKKLLPHSPDYFFTYKLPYSYDREAETPKWDSFLHRTFKGAEEYLLPVQQMFGYCILDNKLFLETAFILNGGGSNGKSTLINTLRSLIGSERCSSVPVSCFSKPEQTAPLDGSLLNTNEEIPNGFLDTMSFKDVVSGGIISVNEKYIPRYTIKNKARIVFACNELPRFKEYNEAIDRRICLIPFINTVKKEDRNPFIEEELRGELSGILNWAIKGAEMLRDENGNYKNLLYKPDTPLYDFKKESDPVHSFFVDCIEFDELAGAVPFNDLYNKYKSYNDEEFGFNNVTKKTFSLKLKHYLCSNYSLSDKYYNEVVKSKSNGQRYLRKLKVSY